MRNVPTGLRDAEPGLMPLAPNESVLNRLSHAYLHLTFHLAVDDTTSIRLAEARRSTPFPGSTGRKSLDLR